jgi:spore germination cell wall hydrolase CwlJ-like protein
MISLAATCLALTVYFESRGEPSMGQHYVAHVVMNRSEDYEGKKICAAVFDRNQFSWVNDIRRSNDLSVMARRALKNVSDKKAWDESLDVASKVISRRRDITHGAMYFNERRMGIRYVTSIKPKRIGNQIYY